MPKPNAHHARLAALAGRWEGEETMHPSPWVPEERVGSATLENRVGAGGFVLAQDYVQRMGDEVTFQAHGVFSIHDGEVRLHWWDAMGMGPEIFRGAWEGERLVLRARSPMGHTRTTWIVRGDTYEHVMEMSKDGEAWSVLMEGRYRRLRARV